MSGGVQFPGAPANLYAGPAYGTLGDVLANTSAVRQQISLLTEQSASGKVSASYAGLGFGATTSLSLDPVLAQQQTWQSNIDAATGTMNVAQTALSQISQIASSFYAQTNTLNGLDAGTTDNVAAAARAALQQVAGLLDTKDGNVYVFAGQDSTNPPVPNPDAILSSGFAMQISAAVGGLAASGAAATSAATLAVASSNAAGTSPFSTALSQPPTALAALRTTVNVGAQQSLAAGIVASGNADVPSAGPSTTGSYMRDILRSLATLGSLSSSQNSMPGFAGLVADTRSALSGAITALNGDAGAMGDRQTQLQTIKTGIASTSTALQAQVSGTEDVDMAKTLSNLSAAQTQLTASYQLIAALQGLSLTKFL